MNNHDYFMRQIEDMAQFLTKTFFHKVQVEIPIFDEQGNPIASGLLYGRLKALISEKKINEAENLLFEELEQNKTENYFEVAIAFYKLLNNLSDEQLCSCNYTRMEIKDGLAEVQEMCEEI